MNKEQKKFNEVIKARTSRTRRMIFRQQLENLSKKMELELLIEQLRFLKQVWKRAKLMVWMKNSVSVITN